MTLTLEDRLAITELISLHGHLVDDGSLDRLDELFTPAVVYDLTDFGQGQLVGIAAIREAALALGTANPVAHHVTNIVVAPDTVESDDGRTANNGDRRNETGADGAGPAEEAGPDGAGPSGGEVARVRSKGLGITADGACGSVTYDDIVVRTPQGWRIAHRRVLPRRVPLNGATLG